MEYFLGIDQGRTKTSAVVCNNAGQILASGHARGAYFLLDGIHAQMQALQSAVEDALRQIPCIGNVKGLYAGLIGADWPDEQEMLNQQVANLNLAANSVVVNDCFVAMRGGTKRASGVILIAGTGGNCAIMAPSGDTFLYHFYQENELQGGTALGRSALTAIYRAKTNRAPKTCLTEYVLQMVGYPSVDTLLRHDVEKRLPIDISQLAPLVFKAAENGDTVAVLIIQEFAVGLAGLVTAGLRRFQIADLPIEVVVSGSIFKARNAILYETLTSHIQKVAPKTYLVQARYEPVVGAAILAVEKWGSSLTPDFQKNIEKTSQDLGLIRSSS